METRCAQCGAAMSCNPQGKCWCKELPKGPMRVSEELEGCLCRGCLEGRLKEIEGQREAGSRS